MSRTRVFSVGPLFLNYHESIGHVQLLDASDETVSVLEVETSGHLSPSGCVERVTLYRERRGGQTSDLLLSAFCIPAAVFVRLTLVKSSGLIKPTVRQARAHKRDDESGGMEWALMDIGVELHWQG